ncbi:DUF4276 family protein [Marinobacter mangrovi]|uniref:DUF4276 family protein n=1 Tax=Marinobacter mangrovi TaxID=2803918 RepID=UPI001931B8A3|nr:DUF4276 family protein [Marinobacter mangrovi]
MKHLVFLLEEPSAKNVLDHVLPQCLPDTVTYQCIPHEGKQDLEKSIPRKLRGWRQPGTYFVVIRDKDQSDFETVINRLSNLCHSGGRPETLIRIAIHELESWFIGDLDAVAAAFGEPKITKLKRTAKYRDPDSLANAADELKQIISKYQKLKGSREIAAHMNVDRNTSPSFRDLIMGLSSFTDDIQEGRI